MADSEKTPNIFMLLEIDPDQEWDQITFERRIREKRREWSKWANFPGEKGVKARINLDLVPRLVEVSRDQSQLQAKAAEARKQKA